ncbi:MAG TPA: hypothetical protein DEP69_03500, partial [Acidimicrobiaceae bacterium]|nr:hypothetical protein [Acidimicrobiaceae bacterium]
LAGADRYETSVAVARQFVAAARAAGAPPTAVIVASGESLVDALSAVTLAAALGAPVVLTRAGTLPPSVRAFLAENPFSRVVVIGGTAAVSPAVEAALAAAAAVVERIAGADRFATATAIARRAGIAGDWCDSNQRAAVLVNGSRFADAVVIAPLAYALNLPVLLTDADALPAETARYLADAGIERVVVVGGTAAVSTTTAAATVAAGVSGITRLAGADRYETSVEVVRAIGGCGVEQRDPDSVAFVNGTATADGVVAGPLLGLGLGGNGVTPILLVDADEIPSAVRRWLVTGWPATTSGVVIIREIVPVGGTAVVSDAVVTTAQLLVGPRPQKDEPRQSGAAGGSSPARTGPVV